MYCWQVRRRFADVMEGARREDVARHLASCDGCRARLAGLTRVSGLIAEAARPRPEPAAPRELAAADLADFEDRVVRAARLRAAALRKNASILPAPAPSIASLLRPAPLGAAFSIMLLAVALTQLVAPRAPVVVPAADAPQTAAGADLDDRVAPPREVPFEVQQDLVGTRRGRIPLTTYVLEPAPHETPVMRASL